MLPMRTALDEGAPHEAVRLLDEEMKVATPHDLPADMGSDNALFVLDRGSIHQSLADFDASKRDLEAADKAIDMLDLAHGAKDSIGEYVFSGSSGKYQAPPYEKLLLNTLDMLNYLELGDLANARVEARRLAVMQKYVADDLGETDNSVLGLGGFLAGLTFEESDQVDEALRWYDQAIAFQGFQSMSDSVRQLLARTSFRTPRLKELAASSSGGGASAPAPEGGDGHADLVVVVGYGRVPHKVAERVPIGLALTWFSGALAPTDVAAANRIAAQGLVTWINYPTLGHEQGGYALPAVQVDGSYVQLEEAVNVTHEVRAEWKKIEGKVIMSAITRLVSRYLAGTLVGAAAGRDNGLVGLLLSLGTQATLTALDTPDTRSWETLPARVAVARLRVAPGKHTVHLEARGVRRDVPIDVEKGGCKTVSLMALR
jgi:hypothetical protein